jgi:hypothetical protein
MKNGHMREETNGVTSNNSPCYMWLAGWLSRRVWRDS